MIEIYDASNFESPELIGRAKVIWSTAPDLVIAFFMPPMILSEGGESIPIHDITANRGTAPSPLSVTRYYLSSETPINLANATLLGERIVPALAIREDHKSSAVSVTLPADLGSGIYYIAACADANEAIVELDEQNNCSFNKVKGIQSHVVPMEGPPVADQTIFDLSARAKDSKVDIVWTAVNGVGSYNIYRSSSEGGPYHQIATGHTTDYAVYADFGLVNDTTYYYVVRSLADGVESLNSNEASATPAQRRRR